MRSSELRKLDDFRLAELFVVTQGAVMHARSCRNCRKKLWLRFKWGRTFRRVRRELRRRNMDIVRIEHVSGDFESPRVQSAYETVPSLN
jgi:hypothetical protein